MVINWFTVDEKLPIQQEPVIVVYEQEDLDYNYAVCYYENGNWYSLETGLRKDVLKWSYIENQFNFVGLLNQLKPKLNEQRFLES